VVTGIANLGLICVGNERGWRLLRAVDPNRAYILQGREVDAARVLQVVVVVDPSEGFPERVLLRRNVF
jgi:hypothetical protein